MFLLHSSHIISSSTIWIAAKLALMQVSSLHLWLSSLTINDVKELLSCFVICPETSSHTACDSLCSNLLYSSHDHTKMRRFNHNSNSRWFYSLINNISNLTGNFYPPVLSTALNILPQYILFVLFWTSQWFYHWKVTDAECSREGYHMTLTHAMYINVFYNNSLWASSVKTASFRTCAGLEVYPWVIKSSAFAHRSGVLSSPSRSGSSPIHSRIVRHAPVILLIFVARISSLLPLSLSENLRFLCFFQDHRRNRCKRFLRIVHTFRRLDLSWKSYNLQFCYFSRPFFQYYFVVSALSLI